MGSTAKLNKMKIAYLLTWDITSNDGVTQKVRSQAEYWTRLGHKVKIFCIVNRNKKINSQNSNELIFRTFRIPHLHRLLPPHSFLRDLLGFNPDIVYLRYEHFRPYHLLIKKRFPIVLELNTNLSGELKLSKKLKWKLDYLYYRITYPLLFANVAGVVSVTREIITLLHIQKYHKPWIVLPNSINLGGFEHIRIRSHKKNQKPLLVFIGTRNHRFHGVDKIEYLAEKTISDLNIHVIGVDPPEQGVPENLFFHGYLPREQYINIIQRADVGIGTLALHRNHMNEACPLKVREYIAHGLPVIIGYKDSAFLSKNRPGWILEIPNEENNVKNNIDRIVKFAKEMKGTRIPVAESRFYIGWVESEKKRMAFFFHVVNQRKIGHGKFEDSNTILES